MCCSLLLNRTLFTVLTTPWKTFISLLLTVGEPLRPDSLQTDLWHKHGHQQVLRNSAQVNRPQEETLHDPQMRTTRKLIDMGPIIRHSMINTGMEVVFFAVQDPDYSFYSLENKVDGLQRNEAPKFFSCRFSHSKPTWNRNWSCLLFVIEIFLVLLWKIHCCVSFQVCFFVFFLPKIIKAYFFPCTGHF